MEHDERKTLLNNTASCRNIPWIFSLCREHSVDPNNILHNLPFERSYVEESSNFIEWDYFALLHHNVTRYLSTKELEEAARKSWGKKDFRIYRAVGSLLFNLTDHVLATFGPHGYFAKLYPCDFTVITQDKDKIEIELTMHEGCAPSIPFQAILTGQLSGLVEQMGYIRPQIDYQHTPTGAIYRVSLSPRFGIYVFLKKMLTRSQTAHDAAIELSLTHHQLLDKNIEAQRLGEEVRQLKTALKHSSSNYQLVSEASSEIIWMAEPDKGLTFISPAATALLGYPTSELIEQNQILSVAFTEQVNRLVPSQVQEEDQQTSNPQGSIESWGIWHQPVVDKNSFEIALDHKNGRTVWTRTKLDFAPAENAAGIKIIGVTKDISQERNIEQKLFASEANYKEVVNNAEDGIIILNEKNLVSFANPASARIFGYSHEELIGLALGDLIPEIHSETVQFVDTSINGVMKDGSSVRLEMSLAEQHRQGHNLTTCVFHDVTTQHRIKADREALQEQLLAAQKMESIGQLTGGIAHDFNNLLVAINGFAELSQLKTTSAEERDDFLDQIRRAGNRAAEMTRKLLSFSRRQIVQLKVVDLNTLVSDLNLMIHRLLSENIEVRIHRSLEEIHVLADSGQLEQVIINLAVNAKDAMSDQGKLEISVRNQKVDGSFAHRHPHARPGDFALITVKDTGFGITDEAMEKIFEPFFTTKPEGAGTGLGLSVVSDIVSQHDGFIDVTSSPDEGTCFSIFLPTTESSLDEEKIKPSVTVDGGTETLLLVEDNEHVRDLARIILKGAGYFVIEAVDGADAINQFRQIHKKIDLVIIDVVMPKMGGREVMSHMRAIDPHAKMLFTSGYANQSVHTNFIFEEKLEFLQKPYSTDSLRKKVRQSLTARSNVRNGS